MTPRSRIALDQRPRCRAGPAGRGRSSARRGSRSAGCRPARARSTAAASGRPTACANACRSRSPRPRSSSSCPPVGRGRVEGGVQVERLPHPDLVGQLALLELHADLLAQRVAVAPRVETEDPDAPPSRACAGRRSIRRWWSCRRRSGPRMAKISPSSTANETPSTTTRSPYRLEMLSTSMRLMPRGWAHDPR